MLFCCPFSSHGPVTGSSTTHPPVPIPGAHLLLLPSGPMLTPTQLLQQRNTSSKYLLLLDKEALLNSGTKYNWGIWSWQRDQSTQVVNAPRTVHADALIQTMQKLMKEKATHWKPSRYAECVSSWKMVSQTKTAMITHDNFRVNIHFSRAICGSLVY